MPPDAYLVGGMPLFTHLKPLNFVTQHVIVTCPCFSYAKAWSYVDAPFLGPKWSICPKQIFFKKNY